MMSPPHWHFAGFRLDPDNACLWHGTSALPLPPKAFALLQYLVTHAGRLVTKEELLDACWPETAVSDGVLKVHIAELRKALGETGRTPRFIATVHRRGYRFVAPVTAAGLSESTPPAPSLPALSLSPSPPLLIGREAVLQRLYAAWAQACQGQRQVIWVTGEAGIGKTAVVEAFAAEVAADPTVWLAHGQCVEHYGTGEAYLPILEALGRLCRTLRGEQLIPLLRQRAPTWLVQMPWLLRPEDRELLRQELQGTTRERMLREFAEVVDTLTVDTPLLLMLEDLHWSDHATLDVLFLLARRRTPARLLLLGTYRPVETVAHGHPLRTATHELRRHGYSTELPLTLLSAEAVAAYLAARFPVQRFPESLDALLHQVTDGSPLFLVAMVEALVARSVLTVHDGCWTLQEGLDEVAIGVPEDLRQMLEHQLERVPPEAQRVLEAASVAGVTFAVAAVAAALEDDVMHIETHCEELVQRHLLRPAEMLIWPDGTTAVCYAFVHALYQQVAYERLARGRRAYLHQCLGMCLEAAYGAQATEIAAELAVHFEHGHDVRRAVQYWQQAAANAARRSGHHEVIRTLTRARALLTQWPDTRERAHQELVLLTALGPTLMATRGVAAPEVAQTYLRNQALAHHMEESPRGLWLFYYMRGEIETAREFGVQLMAFAQRRHDSSLLFEAHMVLGMTLFRLGEVLPARIHLEQGTALYDPTQHHAQAFLYAADPGVILLCYAARALWLLGYPAQAVERSQAALTLADQLSHPFSQAYAVTWTAFLQQLRRDRHAVEARVEEVSRRSTEQGFPFLAEAGAFLQGWAQAEQGQRDVGIAQMSQALVGPRAAGVDQGLPYWLALLAEAYGKSAQTEEGLALLSEALPVADKAGGRYWAAELYRLKGVLLLRQHAPDATQAETWLTQALAIARRQQVKSWELRATLSLSRLWQQQGKQDEARKLLTEVYGWFTEGFDTADLQEARALLDVLTAG
jgi:DNA-binding winged helix-turn-helix (wHTH) protein/predicted ATPase